MAFLNAGFGESVHNDFGIQEWKTINYECFVYKFLSIRPSICAYMYNEILKRNISHRTFDNSKKAF